MRPCRKSGGSSGVHMGCSLKVSGVGELGGAVEVEEDGGGAGLLVVPGRDGCRVGEVAVDGFEEECAGVVGLVTVAAGFDADGADGAAGAVDVAVVAEAALEPAAGCDVGAGPVEEVGER